MSIEQPDILTRLIATIVPAVVVECSKRLGVCTDELYTTLEADVISGCDFDVETIDERDTSKLLAAGLTNVQSMKVKLHEIWKEAQRQLVDDVRVAIKDELRMEMYIELQKLHEQMQGSTLGSTLGDDQEQCVSKGNRTFDIPHKVTGVTRTHTNVRNPLSFSTVASFDDMIAAEDTLKDNTLYSLVSNNIDRLHTNAPMFTIDDFISTRHFDKKTMGDINESKRLIEEYEIRQMKNDQDVGYDSEGENTRWDKLLEDKLASNT